MEEILNKNLPKFVKDLQHVDKIANILADKGIFAESQRQEIVAANLTRNAKNIELLRVLPMHEDHDDYFYDILKDTQQWELADLLRPDLAQTTKAERTRHIESSKHISQAVGLSHNCEDYQPDILPSKWPDHDPNRKTEVKLCQRDAATLANYNSEMNYQMRSTPRGRALIISNNFYSGASSKVYPDQLLPKREGTDSDRKTLVKLLGKKGLNFSLNAPEDLSGKEMKDRLKEEAKKDHGDCFILCILSRGLNNAIYGNDGDVVSTEEIVSYFDKNYNPECQIPQDKPKIFIFDASRGDEENKYLVTESGAVSEIESSESNPESMANFPILKEHKNCFLAFSTSPGYVDWRDVNSGSIFIQALVRVFSDFSYKDDICDLMTKVNHLVGIADLPYDEVDQNGVLKKYKVKQTSISMDYLDHRAFYFFPGLSDSS